jgi:hypothetical protein
MELAADAIRGHKSAHSFATGPVIADPANVFKHFQHQCYEYYYSPVKSVHTYSSQQNGKSRTLHFALGVDDDARVILEIDEDAILAPPRLPLADDNRRHNCST